MQYESPGDAFSSSLQDTMMAQATAKRQAMLDALAQKKDAHQFSMQEQELEVRRMEMQERAQERAAANEEKKAALADKQNEEANKASEKGRSDTVDTLSRLVPGDVLSSDMVADVKKHNLTDLMKQQQMPIRLGQTSIPLEPAESQNMVNKGTPEQQKPPTARGPVHVTFRDPKTGENQERWVSEEDAVKMGQMESPTQPKPVTEPREPADHFTFQPEMVNGKYTGRMIKLNSKTGTYSMAHSDDGTGPVQTKANPGAAALSTEQAHGSNAVKVLDLLDASIDKADKAGVIGPEAGRYANVEQWIGDPETATTELGVNMRAARLYMDSAVGGVRAAGNAALAAQWDQFLSGKLTVENLHAAVAAMKKLAEVTAASTAKPTAADLIKQYGGGQ